MKFWPRKTNNVWALFLGALPFCIGIVTIFVSTWSDHCDSLIKQIGHDSLIKQMGSTLRNLRVALYNFINQITSSMTNQLIDISFCNACVLLWKPRHNCPDLNVLSDELILHFFLHYTMLYHAQSQLYFENKSKKALFRPIEHIWKDIASAEKQVVCGFCSKKKYKKAFLEHIQTNKHQKDDHRSR
jgi:hypothetical protein